MENIKTITPGKTVWVIVRDEIGEPVDIDGYLFLANTMGAVILTPYINNLTHLDDVIKHLIEETAEDNRLPLVIFPDTDCYLSYEDAQAAMVQETGDREDNEFSPES